MGEPMPVNLRMTDNKGFNTDNVVVNVLIGYYNHPVSLAYPKRIPLLLG